ncbi:BRO1-like domain-containing protein [Gongronella butleri]|nr:BRO1-like domain-containing protein [Gongronella butleri]
MSLQQASPPATPASPNGTESNMLSGAVKRTDKINWTPYLRDYISNGYAEHPDLYTDDFRLLDELRNDCIYGEQTEKALNRLIKYYAQLVFIGSKFPIDVRIWLILSFFVIFPLIFDRLTAPLCRLASNFPGTWRLPMHRASLVKRGHEASQGRKI